MKLGLSIAFLAAAIAEAHYTFPAIQGGTASGGDWVNVRKTANFQSNGPVTDVTSSAMTCYQLAAGNEGAVTANVNAGSTVTFIAGSSVSHPGPMSFWMAKVPAGQTAATYDGSGANWFKVYQDYPTVASSGLTWVTQNKLAIPVKIPSCIASGDYLVRIEHIALHSASTVGGAQLYISCAQVTVSGGSGTANPTKVAIPGAYKPTDPGLVVNIYYPVPTNYQPPGPKPLVC
ncbi:MAG: hypothetical protein Q9160_004046 [Pyrenula sp. 1 TL-2023]